jgi:modulator of FtsH protease
VDAVIDSWDNFLLAQVGASAALVGLLFVGVSLNLSKILSFPHLPGRAFLALMLMLAVLIVGFLLLIPQQGTTIMAVEVLAVGIPLAIAGVRIEIGVLFSAKNYQRGIALLGSVLLLAVAIGPYLVSGVLLATGNLGGLNWLAVAVIFSTLKATLDAWVLLVEINR